MTESKNQKFDNITKGMSELLKIKNSGYGSSYDKVPEILKIMFKNEEIDLSKVYFTAHLLEKLQRYISSDKIDSLNDAIGYCILERSKYSTSDFLSDSGNELSLSQGEEEKESGIKIDDFWKDVLDFYGIDFRISKAIEELTELKNALLAYQSISRGEKCKSDIVDEIADVIITIQPLLKYFDENNSKLKEAKSRKLIKFVKIFNEDNEFPKGSVNID